MKDRIMQGLQDHPLVEPVLEEARARGETVYLVGGAVRDMALGLVPKDLDFATEKPYEMAQSIARRYGSRVVSLGKEAFSTYRIPLGGFFLDWVGLAGGSIDSDLRRRDFTVNAIAVDPDTGVFLDPTGGFPDLQRSCLRMASPTALRDDPVRILKAYRMLAQFPSLELDPATEVALSGEKDALMDVPPDRLHVELERLFQCERPGLAVERMAASGVLFILVPEMAALSGLDQNHFHHADVLNHSIEALSRCDGGIPWLKGLGLGPFNAHQVLVLRLACLLHDLGKAETKSVDERGVHFYGHPKPSAENALVILKRLRFSNAVAEQVSELCLNHLRPLALLKTEPRKTAVRRLIHSMGDLLPLLLALSYADKASARGKDAEKNLSELTGLCAEVRATAEEEGRRLRKLPKLVDGLRACEILGLQRPGRELGHALDALLERQVEGSITDVHQAEAFLRDWAARHQAVAKE